MYFHASTECYIHIDANCFFVSCERLRHPELAHAPIAVGWDIIISASYECRKYGIHAGTPIWQAREILGNSLTIIRPDLLWYSKISRDFFDLLRMYVLQVEPFSIDEAFASITGLPELRFGGDIQAFIQDLQQKILSKIGIPVSIGVSNTRIKAKILSDIQKPLGITIGIDREIELGFFKKLPVRDIPFIGKGNESRLGIGVKTIEDYQNLSFFEIDRIIGKNGTILWLELHGVDVWRGTPENKAQKSILRSRSFNHEMTDNPHILWRRILANFDQAYHELILSGLEMREVGVMLRTKSLERFWKGHDFFETTTDRKKILEEIRTCFEQVFQTGKIYRGTWVLFSGLSQAHPRQMSLFSVDEENCKRNMHLEKTIEAINIRYGKGSIMIGKL